LPRRPLPGSPEGLWLPALGRLAADEPLTYRIGVVGPRGQAWLRAWEAAGGGHLAVLSWVEGLVIGEVARPLRGMLAERFGTPFALAEVKAGSVDFILPPVPGQDQGWMRLFPPAEDSPYREQMDVWWSVYGETVLSA
jgi:hypothetical protein